MLVKSRLPNTNKTSFITLLHTNVKTNGLMSRHCGLEACKREAAAWFSTKSMTHTHTHKDRCAHWATHSFQLWLPSSVSDHMTTESHLCPVSESIAASSHLCEESSQTLRMTTHTSSLPLHAVHFAVPQVVSSLLYLTYLSMCISLRSKLWASCLLGCSVAWGSGCIFAIMFWFLLFVKQYANSLNQDLSDCM